ncbi:MAG: hypothetical protein IJU44_04205 [Kiritimatiellae bacterium]|nr:hypothetical protein [Kiritimatiellia bacterium]
MKIRNNPMAMLSILQMVLAAILWNGCCSYLFEGYPLTEVNNIPALRYRVDKVMLRYGASFPCQTAFADHNITLDDFIRLRPDVFGKDGSCVPITVRLRVLDAKESNPAVPILCSIFSLTLVPLWYEWNDVHEVTVALAGDEKLSHKGQLKNMYSIRMSCYFPTGFIRRSHHNECVFYDGGRVFSVYGTYFDQSANEKNLDVIRRTLVEEVVRILGDMERSRIK